VSTVLGFSLGFLALGAVVTVINVLAIVFTIAFTVYASLALIGVVVFSVIGIRRLMARRRDAPSQPQPHDPAPPHVVTPHGGR
jgi:uncharacterized SAM-binding protein YcdF (DUF218 family)